METLDALLHNSTTNPIGIYLLGGTCQQSPLALWLWHRLITEQKPRRLIELGTGTGYFSAYLWLLCMTRRADFQTYDIGDRHTRNPLFALPELAAAAHQCDIFEQKAEIGAAVRQPGRSLLHLDNGEKVRVIAEFSVFAKPGDIIAVHDWNAGVRAEHLPQEGFRPLHRELWDDSYTACMERT